MTRSISAHLHQPTPSHHSTTPHTSKLQPTTISASYQHRENVDSHHHPNYRHHNRRRGHHHNRQSSTTPPSDSDTPSSLSPSQSPSTWKNRHHHHHRLAAGGGGGDGGGPIRKLRETLTKKLSRTAWAEREALKKKDNPNHNHRNSTGGIVGGIVGGIGLGGGGGIVAGNGNDNNLHYCRVPLTERNVGNWVEAQECEEVYFPDRFNTDLTVSAWLERVAST